MVRMLTRWILLAGVAAGMLCGTAWGEESAPKGPVAAVENEVYDFGSVFAGKDILHSFEIQNTGDAPLVIEDVKTG